MNVLLVAIGGALGAGSRYLLGGWIQSRASSTFPWSTFIINVSGAFLIGIVYGFVERGILSANTRLLLATGVLGGYTTFSTFSFETMSLIVSGSKGMALLNTIGQTVIGLIAVFSGLILVRSAMA
ncbi:MAG: fluoride efflux transporter CrcB [Candidatus Dadabacteria bacterium]